MSDINKIKWNTFSGWTPYDARLKEIEIEQHMVRHYQDVGDEENLRDCAARVEALIDAQAFELRARLEAGLDGPEPT